jgi:hypothetical protein
LRKTTCSTHRITAILLFQKEFAMLMTQNERDLRDRFFNAMLEATFPLQQGEDQEVTLQALIQAADLLRQRFEQELDELRQESD